MALIEELDTGTPIRPNEETVTLTIDGESVTVPKGTSVMAAAMSMGTKIPRLCATDSLEPFGSCRLCLVEIEGRRGTPASCTTPADQGMVVHTQNERLAKLRKGVMELYISDHPLNCLTCSANGDCELQDQAGAVGLREVRYGYSPATTTSTPRPMQFEPLFHLREIGEVHRLQSRCVRACEEVQGTFALTIQGRGFGSKPFRPSGTDFFNSECVSCGACVQACPTATLNEKSVIEMGKAGTFGHDHLRLLRRRLHVQGRNAGRDGRPHAARPRPARPMTGTAASRAGSPTAMPRTRTGSSNPMVREKITDPVARGLLGGGDRPCGVRVQTHPDDVRQAIPSVASPRPAARTKRPILVQKLVRAGFGNNNVDTCARVCHSPTGYGLKTTLGTSAGTQDFKSVEQCGRHPRDRRQPDRWPPRVRLAHEEAPARRRQAHRRRSAQDRPREVAPHQGGLPPAVEARHQCRLHQCDERM